MKWLIVPITLTLNGCAYTAVSTVTWAVTGKSIGDHTASLATQNDCNTYKFAVKEQDYPCERARTPDSTYNRDPF